ncbi:MAG: pentapeptide repeat-containing protein [Pseudomonadota bacterium]
MRFLNVFSGARGGGVAPSQSFFDTPIRRKGRTGARYADIQVDPITTERVGLPDAQDENRQETSWDDVIAELENRSGDEIIEFKDRDIVDASDEGLTGVSLEGAHFINCRFDYASFLCSSVKNVRFVRCEFYSLDFFGCLLYRVSFDQCIIRWLVLKPILPANAFKDDAQLSKILRRFDKPLSDIYPDEFNNDFFDKDVKATVETPNGIMVRPVAHDLHIVNCHVTNVVDIYCAIIHTFHIGSSLVADIWFEPGCFVKDDNDNFQFRYYPTKGELEDFTQSEVYVFSCKNTVYNSFYVRWSKFRTMRFERDYVYPGPLERGTAVRDFRVNDSHIKRFSFYGTVRNLLFFNTNFDWAVFQKFSTVLASPNRPVGRGATTETKNKEKNDAVSRYLEETFTYFGPVDRALGNEPSFSIANCKLKVFNASDVQFDAPKIIDTFIKKVDFDGARFHDGSLHYSIIEGGKANGVEFSKMIVAYTNFHNVAFIESEAEKKKEAADFSESQFDGVSFAGSDLKGATFVEAQFNGAVNNIRDAKTISYANFDESTGLTLNDFSGLNLSGVILPDTLDLNDIRASIENISRHGQRMFLVLGLLLAFACIVTFNIAFPGDAADAVEQTSRLDKVSPLPWLNLVITVGQFFAIFPVLIFSFFMYFHVFVLRLWSDLSLLPAIMPDGRAADRAVYPWIIASLSRSSVPKRVIQEAGADRALVLQPFIAFLVGYLAAPATLCFMAFAAVEAKIGAVAAWVAICTLGTGALSVWFFAMIGRTLQKRWR